MIFILIDIFCINIYNYHIKIAKNREIFASFKRKNEKWHSENQRKKFIVLVIAILVVVAVVAFANSKSDDGNKTDVVDNTDPVYQVETTISDIASDTY